MSDHCKFYKCTRIVEKDGYCFLHKMYAGASTSATIHKDIVAGSPIAKLQKKKESNAKPRKPIAKQSKKRKKEQPVYVAMVKAAAAEDDSCEVRSPVCTGKMQGFNHTQKTSPKNRLDRENLKRCCNACNDYIEKNTEWAEENGHLISRFKK